MKRSIKSRFCISYKLSISSMIKALQSFKRALSTSANKLKVGNAIHGFKVKKETNVDALSLRMLQLEHQKTGALYVHIDRDDSNNVFR